MFGVLCFVLVGIDNRIGDSCDFDSDAFDFFANVGFNRFVVLV